MTDELTKQEEKRITDSYERERDIYLKAYEDSRNLLNRSLEANDLAGIERANKNMGEASDILDKVKRWEKEALKELQTAENATKTGQKESLSQNTAQNVLGEQKETLEKSEEEDYYYGYGM